jgi:LysM repeat protein
MAASASRRRLAHYAAPVAFLAAVTIAVLLIRSGLGAGGPAATTTTLGAGTTTTTSVSKPAHRKRHPEKHHAAPAKYYIVQSGDTFGTIASREGTSVARLEALNPGVSTNALAVGQKLRVK